MLSIKDLNNFNNHVVFKKILKEKLSKKKFENIVRESNYNKKIIELQTNLVNLQNWVKKNMDIYVHLLYGRKLIKLKKLKLI